MYTSLFGLSLPTTKISIATGPHRIRSHLSAFSLFRQHHHPKPSLSLSPALEEKEPI